MDAASGTISKWKPYPKYKDFGVEWLGEIPAHWKILSIKRISRIRYGLSQPPIELIDGVPLIRATNVKSGKILEKDMLYVDPADVPQNRDAILSAGDIIVVRSGAYTGDSAIIPEKYVFFAGQEPTETDAISVNIKYNTKKMVIHDGETAYPAIDNLVDLVDIQAQLMYHPVANFTPNALATHLPANGTYQMVGGADGAAVTTADYAEAMDVLMTYMEDTLTNITSCVFCRNTIEEGRYDLIPVLAGKLNEAKKNFYPFMGFIGLDANEAPAKAIAIASNFANYALSVVVNPWDVSTPYRMDAAVARAAQEATAPLGTSCARRVTNMTLQGLSPYGLLNTYRKETVRALHNGRLDVLVKGEGGGIWSFYGRNTAFEDQYKECVDIRTVFYMIWVIKYYTDQFYFAKNVPSERATLREDLAGVLDRLVSEEVMDAYTLTVKSGRPEGNKGLVRVKLEAENVGHIKQFVVDYYNGIIEGANVAV